VYFDSFFPNTLKDCTATQTQKLTSMHQSMRHHSILCS